jgi:serine/threonine-protein kinase RsbW
LTAVAPDGGIASCGQACRREISIPNDTSCLAAVREAVREAVVAGGFPQELLGRVTLAVDESITNIMEHAYEDDLEGELKIEIVLEVEPTQFVARLKDRGKSFDPRNVPPPDLKRHVSEGRKHGLGVFLVRRIMDEVDYTACEDGVNELKLVKRATPCR